MIASPAPIQTVPLDWSASRKRTKPPGRLRIERAAPRPERERQQQRRHEQRDRERDVRDQKHGEEGGGHRRNCRCGPASSPSGGPDGLERDPVGLVPAADELEARTPRAPPHLRLAVDEDARRDQRAAGDDLGGERGPRARRACPRSGWRGRGRTGPRSVGIEPSRARIRFPTRLWRALASVASMAIGSMSTPRARVAPELDRRDREDPRAAADVEDAAERPAIRARPRAPARHSRVVGWSPVPKAIPGSRSMTTSSPARWCRRQLGLITSRRPSGSTWKCCLPRLGPVGLVDDARPQLADRPEAERLEVPERRLDGRDGALRIAASSSAGT